MKPETRERIRNLAKSFRDFTRFYESSGSLEEVTFGDLRAMIARNEGRVEILEKTVEELEATIDWE